MCRWMDSYLIHSSNILNHLAELMLLLMLVFLLVLINFSIHNRSYGNMCRLIMFLWVLRLYWEPSHLYSVRAKIKMSKLSSIQLCFWLKLVFFLKIRYIFIMMYGRELKPGPFTARRSGDLRRITGRLCRVDRSYHFVIQK